MPYYDDPNYDIELVDHLDKRFTQYFRYYPAHQAYFVDQAIQRKAEIVTYDEMAKRINDGTYNYDSVHDLDVRDSDGTGRVMLLSSESKTIDIKPLPTGMFRVIWNNNHGVGLQPYRPQFDDYVDLKTHTSELQDDIDTFIKSKEEYKKLGLLHRRGILLYGPPGTGKTRLLEHICSTYADNVRILSVPSSFVFKTLLDLKDLLTDHMTFFIFEELTTAVDDERSSSNFLNFMDGEDSWDNCLVLATTNYPEKLPGNIVDRPSRFDRLYRLGNPSDETRRLYLTAKLGTEIVTDVLVKATKNYSVAYLKELVLSVVNFKKDPFVVIKEFEQRKRVIKQEFAEKKAAGFGFSIDEN